MGGTASTRRVTFEADENENITVVKGIRVSAVGGRRAAFDLGSQRRDVPGTAAPASLLSARPAVPLEVWVSGKKLVVSRLGTSIQRKFLVVCQEPCTVPGWWCRVIRVVLAH